MTRPIRWFLAVAGVVVVVTTELTAQVVPHPYEALVREERAIARDLEQGLVRRANRDLHQLQRRHAHSAADDALPFRHSEVDQASRNAQASDRSLEQFTRTRPNAPGVPYAWVERGLAALEVEDYPMAADYLEIGAHRAEQDLKRRGDEAYRQLAHMARYWQGVARSRAGMFAEAIASFEDAVAVDSTGRYADRCLFAIGQVYERNGRTDDAILAYARIRTDHPTGAAAIAARIREAQNHLRLRRPERAVDILVGIDGMIAGATSEEAVEEHDPLLIDHAAEEVLVLRTTALLMRNQFSMALDSCGVFFERHEDSPYENLVHLHAGYAALQTGSFTAALQHFDLLKERISDESSLVRQQALLYRAVALKKNGQNNEAARAFLDLAARSDYLYRAQALVEVGQGAYENGRFPDAVKAFERAVRTSEDAATTIRAQLLLGATLIEQQNWQKAARAYERAGDLAAQASDAFVPNRQSALAEARLKRGICLVQANDGRNAIAALTDFLGNHPKDSRQSEATFWLAESMYREDLLKNAAELYQEIVLDQTASPRREEAMYGLAWTQFRRRELRRSAESFTKLLETYPESRYAVDALIRKGDALYILKEFRTAARQYEEAARRSPNSQEGLYAGYQTGKSLYQAGDLQEASNRLRAYVSRHTLSRLADDALFLVGWIEFQRQNDSLAIIEFRRLLEAYPDGDHAVRALYTIADAYYNLGKMDASIGTYRDVIARYPSHPLAAEAAKSMQLALMGMGRTDEALAVSDTLINANPNSVMAEDFTFKKAEIFYSGQNYQNAADELQAYIQKFPSSQRNDEAMYLLGKTYLSMDEVDQAIRAFKDLEKRHPESPRVAEAKLDLAAYYDNMANATAADSLYAIVMNDHAKDSAQASRAGFERATLARMRGDTAASLQIYETIADRYAGSEYGDQARYQIATHYRRSGKIDSAREQLATLVRTASSRLVAANALYDIGDTYARQRRWEEASSIFERVREEYAGYEDWYTLALIGLGACYEQLERDEDAKAVYGVVVELRPDDDYGRTAQARLDRLERKQ